MRLLRALVLTGSSVGLGGLAHIHAEASSLGVGSALAIAGVLALSWVATARQVTWPVIALILAVGQVLTHLALVPRTGAVPHQHGADPVSLPAVSLPAVAPVDGRMVLLHAGAWIALTILFTLGERALWRSVRRLVTPWSLPAMPLPRPRLAVDASFSAPSALAHRRVQGRAPPLG